MSIFVNGIDNPSYKHGMTKTPLYFVWVDMIRRCEKKNRVAYKNYGGRGISVCAEWHNSSVFIEWALNNGYNKYLILDRIDNNGNYNPDNCRFVTRTESELNKRKRDDYDIFYKNGVYRIIAKRNSRTYYGGITDNIIKARILRDKLINRLNSGNYNPIQRNLTDECDKIILQRDIKTGRYMPYFKQ